MRAPLRTSSAAPSARLSLEQMELREVPAVFVLDGGVATFRGDGANDTVIVTQPSNGIVRFNVNGQLSQTTADQVGRIVFSGGDGNDRFENWTAVPGSYEGGNGNDLLAGGNGNDVFLGSPGRDRYIGAGGSDVLNRRGFDGFFEDGTTADATVGLASRRLLAAELNAQGQLNVSLSPGQLIFNGPSGAGFTIASDGWRMVAGTSGPEFVTQKDITLRTAWGDMTIPTNGATTRVATLATPLSWVGKFSEITIGGVSLTNGGLTTTYSNKLSELTGASVSMPNLKWGIALGRDVGDADAPLNPAVPYLYATANTGYSFGYENVSVTTPDAYKATVAFAPGDGTIYGGITGLPVIGDFAIGVSTNGYLPYTPEKIPSGLGDPQIYGHYYIRGQVDFGDAGLPIGVSGELVLDLDANDDGTLLGGAFSAKRVKAAIAEFERNLMSPEKLLNSASSILSDVGVGVNTALDLSFQGIGMNLTRSSFWVKPNEIAFRGGTSNPLEGIPMAEKFNQDSPGGLDVQGFLSSPAPGQVRWGFGASAGVLSAIVGAGFEVRAGSDLGGFFVQGRLRINFGGEIVEARVSGMFYFNGDFSLFGGFEFNGHTYGLQLGKKDGKSFFNVVF